MQRVGFGVTREVEGMTPLMWTTMKSYRIWFAVEYPQPPIQSLWLTITRTLPLADGIQRAVRWCDEIRKSAKEISLSPSQQKFSFLLVILSLVERARVLRTLIHPRHTDESDFTVWKSRFCWFWMVWFACEYGYGNVCWALVPISVSGRLIAPVLMTLRAFGLICGSFGCFT